MKKQIDPNLAGSADELFLAGTQEAVPAELQNSEEPFKIQEGVKDTSPDADAYSESAHHHSSSGSHSHHYYSSSHHHHHHHHRHGRHHRHRHGSKHKIPLWARIILVILALIIAAVGIIGGTYIGLREKGKNDLVVEQANPKYEETIEYCPGMTLADLNAQFLQKLQATRDDEDVSNQIQFVSQKDSLLHLGTYELQYTWMDSDDIVLTYAAHVVDTTAPELDGTKEYSVQTGSSFADLRTGI